MLTGIGGELGEDDLRLGSSCAVAGSEQPVSGCDESRGARPGSSVESATQMELEPRPLGVIRRPQLECLLVETCSCGEGVQSERSISRASKREARTVSKRQCGVKVECREIVVGDRLGVVVGPAQRLDPLRRDPVLLSSVGPRDLPVCDVSDEDVPERPLAVIRDRRGLRMRYELLPLECSKTFLDRPAVERGDGGEASRPEHLANHCGGLE